MGLQSPEIAPFSGSDSEQVAYEPRLALGVRAATGGSPATSRPE